MSPLRFIILPVLLLILDFYFFSGLQALTRDSSPHRRTVAQIVYWTIAVFGYICIIYATATPQHKWPLFFKTYITSVLFVIYFSKLVGCLFLLVDDIIRLFRWAYQFFATIKHPEQREGISRLKFLVYVSGTFFTLPFVSMLYGIFRGGYDYRVHKSRIAFKNLPASFDGLKIVQVSDIHTGSFSESHHLSKAFDMILELKPDIIFFTGDLVNNEARETEGFLPVYQKLKAPMGVYSILGNHDYGDYVEWPDAATKKENLDALKNVHRLAGWRLLLNEHVPLEKNGEKIALLGIENWGANGRLNKKYGRMDLAHKGTEEYPFKILLSHDPSHWDKQVRAEYKDVDITLSGHTHGMQFGIEIPGFKWSPVKYIYPQWAGLYKKEEQYLYVNRGLGFLGYNGRVGIWPEITLLELNRA